MSVTTNALSKNQAVNQSIALPKFLSIKWDINQWLRVTKKHSILSAYNKESNALQILELIPNRFYNKRLWKTLLHLPDDKLLVPERIYPIEQMHVLVFPYHTSLKELVRTKGISFPQIVQLILNLCDSLFCLHRANILHGDISVDNIYLTDNKQFILGDFSESYFLDKTISLSKKPPSTSMSSYHDKKAISTQTDLTSLGKLFYQLCNHGNPLLENDSHLSLVDLPIFQTDPDLLETFLPILSKLLTKNSMEQYADLLSFQKDLKTLSLQRMEQVNYQLFLPEETHVFHQTITRQETEPKSNICHFFFSIPFILLSAVTFILLLFLLLWPHFMDSGKNMIPTKSNTNHATISSGAAITATTISPASAHPILDIANQNLTLLTPDLWNNQLKEEIYVLLAEENEISDLSTLTALPNLREIYLSNNQISDLQSLASLPNLEIAVLSDNYCNNLSGLEELDHLRFLDLSGNQKLENIDPLFHLASLETLILTDTSLSKNSIEALQQSLPDCNIIF